MFDMRLSLAVGDLTLRSVRSLPYPLYKRWQYYSMVEPFGFPDREYRTGAVLSQIHNSHIMKKSQAQKVQKRMRDMPKEIFKHIRNLINKAKQPGVDMDSQEGREQASEEIIKSFEAIFGKRIVRKDK